MNPAVIDIENYCFLRARYLIPIICHQAECLMVSLLLYLFIFYTMIISYKKRHIWLLYSYNAVCMCILLYNCFFMSNRNECIAVYNHCMPWVQCWSNSRHKSADHNKSHAKLCYSCLPLSKISKSCKNNNPSSFSTSTHDCILRDIIMFDIRFSKNNWMYKLSAGRISPSSGGL